MKHLEMFKNQILHYIRIYIRTIFCVCVHVVLVVIIQALPTSDLKQSRPRPSVAHKIDFAEGSQLCLTKPRDEVSVMASSPNDSMSTRGYHSWPYLYRMLARPTHCHGQCPHETNLFYLQQIAWRNCTQAI